MQFNVPDLNFLWGFPVHGTSFTFNDGGLQEINWTLEARGKPGGKVIDPAKLHAALESRFGKPASAREIAYGRDGVLKRLDTTWLVNGERWLYSTYPRGGGNVDLRRLSKDAPAEP
jgi:hypothetical protein